MRRHKVIDVSALKTGAKPNRRYLDDDKLRVFGTDVQNVAQKVARLGIDSHANKGWSSADRIHMVRLSKRIIRADYQKNADVDKRFFLCMRDKRGTGIAVLGEKKNSKLTYAIFSIIAISSFVFTPTTLCGAR